MSEALRKAAERALAFLGYVDKADKKRDFLGFAECDMLTEAQDALRTALAKPEQSEPVITDAMVLAALRVQYPALYKTELRHPSNGPAMQERTEKEISLARKMLEAAFADPPRREPQWIKTSEQYPPEGVRVFWFNPQTNQVGYDTWMGEDYRFNAEYWMHIPGLVEMPTRKPLTPEAIWDNDEIMSKSQGKLLILDLVDLVRAVEQAHGIGVKP